jgi:hypothetical protein
MLFPPELATIARGAEQGELKYLNSVVIVSLRGVLPRNSASRTLVRRFLTMIRFPLVLLAFALPLVAVAENSERPSSGSAAAAGDSKTENLLKATNDPDSWQLELTEGGKGDMKAAGDAIMFTTTETDGTNWHVQAYQTAIDLKNGKDYVVRFKMKAPQANEILLMGIINQDDWHEVGLHEEIGASADFQPYEFVFTAADAVPGNNRIGFILGADKGTVSVKDMTLMER